MWQFLLAAAVAGSGFFARQLFKNGDSIVEKCEEEEEQAVVVEEERKELSDPAKVQVPSSPLASSPSVQSGPKEVGGSLSSERWNSTAGQEGIFRFSSSGGEPGPGSRSRKKAGLGSTGRKRNVGGDKRRVRFQKLEGKSGSTDSDGVVVFDEQRKKGRKYFLCLKRRRTGKNAIGSRGEEIFNWGLGAGIMYMVSAGRAEINKLNSTIEETVKVVQELKTELHKRKLSHDLQDSNCNGKSDTYPRECEGKPNQPVTIKSGGVARGLNYPKSMAFPLSDDGDCASSVLTEEQQPEVPEVDQLEAAFESELRKITCHNFKEAIGTEQRSGLGEFDIEHPSDIVKNGVLADELPGPHEEGTNSNSHQFCGVSPSELDQKLCHLLIEQQESHIIELESRLHSAENKLHEKEAELQTLKDCVRRLTEFSLEASSDEEIESWKVGKEGEKGYDHSSAASELLTGINKIGGQDSVVGMKRVMEF
ncbi:PREDICTED: uncharacterized protein LOC104602669 isoform X2 [Nelumbo nucifera]|uniref:Uncharacterized protein LOC104602669 isoform X2 n=1 Tax=Nelumbo nucifera TaxID=4432 RepID=A0A1U8AD00_NELNU|nr:PREDICTED: uncharacterized protein LOC104602669 isoform X2 [Nelumbo nucifera]